MLLVEFTLGVLGPICLWLAGQFPRASDSRVDPLPGFLMFFGCLFVGPVVIVLVLDGIS